MKQVKWTLILAILLALSTVAGAAEVERRLPGQSDRNLADLASRLAALRPAAANARVLTGAAAMEHLEQKRRAHPAAFAEAAAKLAARGFRPTDMAIVITSGEARPSAAGETIVDSEGEISFWSWDDGDDSTWEGSMYVEDYVTGDALLEDMQFYIAADPVMYWEEAVWQRDGGDFNQMAVGGCSPQTFMTIYWQCVSRCCTAAAGGCARSGAAFWFCFFTRCEGICPLRCSLEAEFRCYM